MLSISIGLVIARDLGAALFPLSDALDGFARFSPWSWGLGGDPLVRGVESWRYPTLIIPALIPAIIGAVGFDRRDIRAP